MHIHFIGIGGIGVSALAKYHLKKGDKVSGSDLVSSEITEALKNSKAKIIIGPHRTKNVLNRIDLVIYSPAVSKNNPELKEAKRLKIKCQSYPEALGELTKKYFTIAVAGTHGKSTVTSMLGILLIKAGLDPTVIVGTKVKEFSPSAGGSNCRIGKTQYLVIEADEHFASFLNYWPKIIVLTSLDADHLDYYKNFKNYISAFKKFISRLPENGKLAVNKDDENIKKIISGQKFSIKKYSIKQPEAKKLKKILKIPGEHNVSNALAALTAARLLKIPDRISFKALSGYKGSWRRFEEKIGHIPNTKYKIIVISDYGHHPAEIKATLKAVRGKWPKKKIRCLYQPHQYQRTYYLFKDFIKVFKQAPIDEIIITDIFDVTGREEKTIKNKINSKKLVKAIKKENVLYLEKDKILNYLKKEIKNEEVLVIMGAGDIYLTAKFFK